MSSCIVCKEGRPLFVRYYGSCMLVYHQILRMTGMTTSTSSRKYNGGYNIVAGPPRPHSLDLSPLDFFFWGQMNSFVYQTPVDLMEHQTARIAIVSADISSTMVFIGRVRRFFVQWCWLCNEFRGQIWNMSHKKCLSVCWIWIVMQSNPVLRQ